MVTGASPGYDPVTTWWDQLSSQSRPPDVVLYFPFARERPATNRFHDPARRWSARSHRRPRPPPGPDRRAQQRTGRAPPGSARRPTQRAGAAHQRRLEGHAPMIPLATDTFRDRGRVALPWVHDRYSG